MFIRLFFNPLTRSPLASQRSLQIVCSAFIILGLLANPAPAQQQQVRVTIENLQPSDGFFITPVWLGFHDGSFDYFNVGSTASNAVEQIAEEGDVAPLRALFASSNPSGQDGVVTGPGGFGSMAGQPPVIDAGEAASAVFGVNTSNRYLSYGTMVIPSNDAFLGNDNALAIELFDASGQFVFSGPRTFTLAQVWDAGTELNNGQGAAFSAVGGTSTTENNPIALHAGLNNFNGTGTAAGTTINFNSASGSPVFRLTVAAVPEPGSLTSLGLVGTIGLLRRRRK